MLEITSRDAHEWRDPRAENFINEFAAFLVSRGCVDEVGARRAKKAQASSGERFDIVLLHLALVAEAELTDRLAEFLGVERIGRQQVPVKGIFINELDRAYLAAVVALPIADDGETLILAMSDPFGDDVAKAIGFTIDRRISVVLMAGSEIKEAVNRLYRETSRDEATAEIEAGGHDDAKRLSELANRAPVIRLVSDLIDRASAVRASDIHIEPNEQHLAVRMRIDGVLHKVDTHSLELAPAVTSRVKIMAGLNIAERRLPQDGRIRMVVRGREIDLRVSTMPTVSGESVVLRLLDTTSVALDFTELGFAQAMRVNFEQLVARPNGIVLVAGPTGSGKTTTLYTALRGIDCSRLKVITVEDPVEYRLPDVNQIQVQPKIGLSFASVLRSTLRQDPDVVMVGEIRDLETARIAVQAALTGHLVLSTVHTNGAVATIARLLDMGIERYLIAATLKGVLSQRLIRTLCGSCSMEAVPSAMLVDLLQRSGLSECATSQVRSHNADGCEHCRYTGYRGRTMIAELMPVGSSLERAIVSGGTHMEIDAAARADGMTPMISDGLGKILSGKTTLDEVLRVTGSF